MTEASSATLDPWALVIGVSGYQHLRSLPSDRDAREFARVLRAPTLCGYPAERVKLLCEEQATKQNIEAALDEIGLSMAGTPVEQRSLLIYFSGHGGVASEDPSECYLMPYDAHPLFPAITGISGQELSIQLERIRAARVTLLLDCCHAGGVAARMRAQTGALQAVTRASLHALQQGEGRVIVAAARAQEETFAKDGLSLFTRHLIEGLSGGAADGCGHVGALDLYKYMAQRVAKETGARQRFVLDVNITHSHPIARLFGIWPGNAGAPSSTQWSELATRLQQQLRQELEGGLFGRPPVGLSAVAELPADTPGGRRKVRRVKTLVESFPDELAKLRAGGCKLALIEGEAGSGKSVCLRSIALALAERARKSKRLERLPLCLNLSELALEGGTIDAAAILRWIRHSVRQRIGVGTGFTIDVDESLASGRWVILCDGFDEIPGVAGANTQNRFVPMYRQALHDFATAHHGCQLILTSRRFPSLPQGLTSGSDGAVYRLLPLDERQRLAIIHSWFHEPRLSDKILGELVDSRSIDAWLGNPMVLNLVCAHRQHEGALPATVHAAFQSLVSRRLGDGAATWGARFASLEEIRDGAEELAFDSLRAEVDGGDSFGEDTARNPVRACLVELRLARGLADGRAEGFEFLHRRLHEFFASAHLLRRALPWNPDLLLTDERYREVAISMLWQGSKLQLDAILESAAGRLERQVAELVANYPQLDAAQLPTSAETLSRLQRKRQPTRFPWPAHALNIAAILSEIRQGTAAEQVASPSVLERARKSAGRLLLGALVLGDRADQVAAVELVGAADVPVLTLIMEWAYTTKSELLQDIAFSRPTHLRRLTPVLDLAIRRMLVTSELAGDLRSDASRIAAQVKRVEADREYSQLFERLSRLRRWDALCWAGVAVLIFVTFGVDVILNPSRGEEFLRGVFAGSLSALDVGKGVESNSATLGALVFVLMPFWYALLERSIWRRAVDLRRKVGSTTLWASTALIQGLRVKIASLLLVFTASPWAYGALLVLGTGLLVRPGSYLAVWNRLFTGWAWWLAPVSVLCSWQLVVAGAIAYILLPVAPQLITGSFSIAAIGGFVAVALVIPAVLIRIALLARDRRRFERFCRMPEVDLEVLLSAMRRQLLQPAEMVRVVRQNGRLKPAAHTQDFLISAIHTIERDYLTSRGPSSVRARLSPRRPSLGSSRQFADWYREHGQRTGLASWYGETLDELTRLYGQARHRAASLALEAGPHVVAEAPGSIAGALSESVVSSDAALRPDRGRYASQQAGSRAGFDGWTRGYPSRQVTKRSPWLWSGAALWLFGMNSVLMLIYSAYHKVVLVEVCGSETTLPASNPTMQQFACSTLSRPESRVDVYFNPRHLRVAVPAQYSGLPELTVSLMLHTTLEDARVHDLTISRDGISGKLPIEDAVYDCVVPWSAVLKLVDDRGREMVDGQIRDPPSSRSDAEAERQPSRGSVL